jgi:hypothetical protein
MESEYIALGATSIPVLHVVHLLRICSGALWGDRGPHTGSRTSGSPRAGHADHLEAKPEGYRLVSALCDPRSHSALRFATVVSGDDEL